MILSIHKLGRWGYNYDITTYALITTWFAGTAPPSLKTVDPPRP